MLQEKEYEEYDEDANNPGIVVILSSEDEVHNILGCNGTPPGLAQGIKTLLV